MKARHRPPTLVSMWMLDVFCCALGCVILLLLLKMRDASLIAEEAANASSDLVDTRIDLLESQAITLRLGADIHENEKHLALLTTDRDEQAKQLALVRTERDKLADRLAVANDAIKVVEGDLALTRQKIDDLAKQLALTEKRSTAVEVDLQKKKVDLAELARKVAEVRKNEEELLSLLKEKEKLRAAAMRQAVEQSGQLTTLESRMRDADKKIEDLAAKSTDAAKTRARVLDLEKQIADASVTIVDLQGTKAKLADKINKLEIESEQRFAGISMTGKNVVFLVDISGSMVRIDESTLDDKKWPIVCDTLTKVMRTLPDLDQFQIIIFSSKASYLLGSEGKWIAYQRGQSINEVSKALAAVKPNADTNLYVALDEAFKFRPRGLDTIYLISDGLPTSGPGLTTQEEQKLHDIERSMILSKHLRRTLKTEWNRPIANQARVRINSIGFFYESPDVGAFLWSLSRENDGSFVGMSRP